MSRKSVISILSAVLILAVGFFIVKYFIDSKEVPKKSSSNITVISVNSEKVSLDTVETSVEYPGRVLSVGQVTLGTEVSGRILKGDVPLKEGQSFRKGDVLINIFSEDIEASLRASQSSYLNTLASILPDLKVDYPNSYNKWYSFLNSIEIGRDLPELPEISSDAERVFIASNGVLSNYYLIEQQIVQLSKYKVLAPFSGSFVSVSKEVGSISSMSGTVAQIISTSSIEVVIPMSTVDGMLTEIGEQGVVSRADGSTVDVKVSRVASYVDESTQMLNVYAKISDSSNLLSGEFLQVKFGGRILESVFEVPRESIFDENSMYQIVDGKIEPVEVEVVSRKDDSTFIRGVEPGTVLVIESLVGAYPGMPVKSI